MERINSTALLRPDFQSRLTRLLAALTEAGSQLAVFETARSPARQESLYAQGRDPSAPGYGRTVTRARAYQSAHQYGLAADLVFHINGGWTWEEPAPGSWAVLTDLAASVGLQTLSFEKPHVQMLPFETHRMTPGPMATADWMAWLRSNCGLEPGAAPVGES